MRMAVRISSGLVDVRWVISTFGPMKNSSVPITRCPLELCSTNLASSATKAGAPSEGDTATAASRLKKASPRLVPSGGVGKAVIPPRPVAGKAIAVIEAARILRGVAADGAGVADLRARDMADGIGQQAVLLPDHRIVLDIGEAGKGADLNAIGRFLHAFHLGNAAEIHHGLGALDALLEPDQAVIAPGHLPGILAVTVQQAQRILELGGLEQIELGHHILDDHFIPLRPC